MKINDKMSFDLKGHVRVEAVCRKTGKVLETMEGSNVVVIDAKKSIMDAVTAPTTNSTITKLETNDDTGSGITQTDLDNPVTALDTYTASTMPDSVGNGHATYAPWEVTGMVVGTPNDITRSFSATIDGVQFNLDNGQKSVVSFALYTGDGRLFAYKRLASHMLVTNLIDINVVWTIGYS